MKLEGRGQVWTNGLFWIKKLELLILKKINKLSIIPKNKWSSGNVIHLLSTCFSNSFFSIFLIQLSFSPFPFSPVFFSSDYPNKLSKWVTGSVTSFASSAAAERAVYALQADGKAQCLVEWSGTRKWKEGREKRGGGASVKPFQLIGRVGSDR